MSDQYGRRVTAGDQYDIGVCDAIELARLSAELEQLEGGDLSSLRRRVERLWLEVGYASSAIISEGRTNMASIKASKPAKRLRDCEAGVEQARTGLRRVEGELTVWQDAVAQARRQVEIAQCGLLRLAADELRKQAAARREEAERVGPDEREDVPIRTSRPDGSSTVTIERRAVHERLYGDATALTARADQLAATADGFERATRELAQLEAAERPADERTVERQRLTVERRRLGVESLRDGLARAVTAIMEEES